jgi:hypothetical protein
MYKEKEMYKDKEMNKEMKEMKEIDHGWTNEHEMVLAEWGDKAMCYKWLHAKSHSKYRQLNTWYTIPVIVMSTLTGTANFAQDKIPESFRGYATMIIGGVNILAGIITTIQQFLKITEINEGHRVSSIVWDKFYRKVKVELSKHRDERTHVKDFFKSATEEYDRLMETSPVIDKNIIELFNATFNKPKINVNPLLENQMKKEINPDEDDGRLKDFFEKLTTPEICDSLVTVKQSIYRPNALEKKQKFLKEIMVDIRSSHGENQEPKNELIREFWETFRKEIKRPPTRDEMIDNLVNSEVDLYIDETMIDDFLSEITKI